MTLQEQLDNYKTNITLFHQMLIMEEPEEDIQTFREQLQIQKNSIVEYIKNNAPLLHSVIQLKELSII